MGPLFKKYFPAAMFLAIATVVSFIDIKQVLPDSALMLDLNPILFLKHIFGTWSIWTPTNLGERRGGAIGFLPMALIYSGITELGGSLLLEQRVFFALILSMSGFGMFSLYRMFWKQYRLLPSVIAGALYMFSPYVLINMKGAMSSLIPYAGLPLIALFVLKFARNPSLYKALLSGILMGALMPGINLTLNLYFFVAIVALLIIDQLFNKGPAQLSYYVMLALATVFGILWWLVPIALSLSNGGANAALLSDQIGALATNTSFIHAFQQTGYWGVGEGWDGIPYIPAARYLSNHFVVALYLCSPVVALVAMWKNWDDKRIKLFAGLFLISIILAVSIYPVADPTPFGRVYLFLYNNIFAFKALRAPYKAIAVMSIVLALVAPRAIRKSENQTGAGEVKMIIFTTGLLFTLLAYAMPFALDRVFPVSYKIGSIPSYWPRALNWLNQQPNQGRALFLPAAVFSVYNWGSPLGNVASSFMNVPGILPSQLTASTSAGEAELQLLATAGVSNSPGAKTSFNRLLNLYHIKYIVVQNDFNWGYYNTPSPSDLHSFLSNQSGVALTRQFGELDIYQVNDSPKSLVGWSSNQGNIQYTGGIGTALQGYKSDLNETFTKAPMVFTGGYSVSASSTWASDPIQFAPWAAVVPHGKGSQSAWVSNVPFARNAWWQVKFPRATTIGVVRVSARNNGVDALPSILDITDGSKTVYAKVSSNGIATADFGGSTAKELRITILGHRSGGPNVGISNVACECIKQPFYKVRPNESGGTVVLDMHTPSIRNVPVKIVLSRRTTFNVSGLFGVQPSTGSVVVHSPSAALTIPVLINGKPLVISDSVIRTVGQSSVGKIISGTVTFPAGATTITRLMNAASRLNELSLNSGNNAADVIHWTGVLTKSGGQSYILSNVPNSGYVLAAYNYDPWWQARSGDSTFQSLQGVASYSDAWRIGNVQRGNVTVSLVTPFDRMLGVWLSAIGLTLLGIMAWLVTFLRRE